MIIILSLKNCHDEIMPESELVEDYEFINNKHRWFSGRIIAFQAVDPGSIPGRCIFTLSTDDSFVHNWIKNTIQRENIEDIRS